MLSHDLARELLARRNNDVCAEVLVDNGDGDLRASRTNLRDGDSTLAPEMNLEPVITYDALTDSIVIRLGAVHAFADED